MVMGGLEGKLSILENVMGKFVNKLICAFKLFITVMASMESEYEAAVP